MKILRNVLLVGGLAAAGAVPVMGQVHKYFSPGTVWTVTMVQMKSGMDQMYSQYLDTKFDPGNKYSVPYAMSTTIIGYNEEKMKELGLPTDTWAVAVAWAPWLSLTVTVASYSPAAL